MVQYFLVAISELSVIGKCLYKVSSIYRLRQISILDYY